MTETPLEASWLSPPGDTIADVLEERGLSRSELAERTGFTPKHINELIHGRASITADTALRLERVLGSTAAFWMNREAQYREALARIESQDALKRDAPWLHELPLADMRKKQWVPSLTDVGAQVAACLRFFGVADVASWRAAYQKPLAAFRTSRSFESSHGSVAAWIRKAELDALSLRCEPWDPTKLKAAIPEIRALTTVAEPKRFLPDLVTLGAACGVAIVLVQAPKGTRASGATKFLSADRALLVLSGRHLCDDHLWFSVFHEIGHLLKHGKKELFVEGIGITNDQENEANAFAADVLVPKDRRAELEGLRSAGAVQAFAKELGISPGIVVGQLQHYGHVRYEWLNHLKVRYQWKREADA